MGGGEGENGDHLPKKQSLIPLLIPCILVSPLLVWIANDIFFHHSMVAILPYIFLPWIIAFISVLAYLSYVVVTVYATILADARKIRIWANREIDIDGNGLISSEEFESFKQRYFTGLEIWGSKLDAMFADRVSDNDGNVLVNEFVDLVKYVFILLDYLKKDEGKSSIPEDSKEWWEESWEELKETEQSVLRDNLVMLTRDSPEDIIGNMMLREMS
tara:strand:- start:670 stop:1317 length:648 start_codon:yes stop_codon:yes gene_type:complete